MNPTQKQISLNRGASRKQIPISSPQTDAAQMVELYRSGMSMPKIAAATGWGTSRVYRTLQQAGVMIRGRHERLPLPPERLKISREMMAEFYLWGASLEQVAAEARVSSTRARQILREMGVKIRPRMAKIEPALPVEMIARRYRDGERATTLAAEAGVRTERIRELLKSLGVPLRHPLGGKWNQWDRKRFPPERIVQWYRDGESVQALAINLGVSREVVRTLLLKRGVHIRGRGGAASARPEELVRDPAEVERLYRAGRSLQAIATACSSTPWRVRTALLKLGVKLRRGGTRGDDFCPPPVSAEKVAELYESGQSVERLAAEAGLSRSKARRMLRQQKVPSRSKAEAMRKPADSRKLSDAEVGRRYQAGETLEALAHAAGSTVAIIRRVLGDRGVALRPKMAQLPFPKERVVTLYREGESVVKIAARAECSRDVIRRILIQADVPLRSLDAARALSAAPVLLSSEAIQSRYEGGESLSQIGAAAGIDLTRVAAILRRRGVVLRRRGATAQAEHAGLKITPAEIVELYAAGRTLVQIAELAGSNRRRMRDLLKRRGVKIRNRR